MGQEADTLLIHFHQDKIYYDAPYLGNDETMRRIAASVEALGPEHLESIEIVGYASPEGASGRNDYLSRSRSGEVSFQVRGCIPQWANALVDVRPGFESWDLLRRRIREDEQLSEAKRSQIIAILDDPSVGNATKKWRLMNRLGTEEGIGDVWEYLFRQHFIYLRCVFVILHHRAVDGDQAERPAAAVVADTAAREHSGSEFNFYFRRGRSGLDPDYMGNRATQEALCSLLEARPGVDSVAIYSWSSPEGGALLNARLSKDRAGSAAKLLGEMLPLGEDQIKIHSNEENWPGLQDAVRDVYQGEDRQEILSILEDGSRTDEQRKQALKGLDQLMDPLRCARVVVFAKPLASPLTAVQPEGRVEGGESISIATQSPREIKVFEPEAPAAWDKRTVVAVKTNALYDLATITNYAVEVPIGKQFSAVFEHYCPWWSTKRDLKYCMQYLSLGGEFRWWFAPQPRIETSDRMLRDVLVGHFMGVYALYCKTDIQWERKVGMYQCNPIFSAGLSYGYAFPLTKHWNMELSATVGYARIPYQHYIPSEDWQILWRDREDQGVLHYFGPTQLKVSLIRPILVKYRVK